MAKNFGWGSRVMPDAARNAMQKMTDNSFKTIADCEQRFSKFCEYAKDNGVGRLERVTKELVIEYGRELADKVDAEEMKASTAQVYVSAVNTAMKAASRGNWKSVSPTRECNISQRSHIRETPTISRENAERAIQSLNSQGLDRQAAVASLALNLGLRSKEASLLNAKTALAQAEKRGVVTISDGTKGGREREIPITHERQIEALKEAANAQGAARAVMPGNENWKEWRGGGLREAREHVQSVASATGLHDLRASYASERYQSLTGHPAPCEGGKITDREADKAARLQISSELGHNRIDVVSAYLGGRG